MAELINVTTAVAATATEGDFKNWLSSVYNYLVGLFGADGTKTTAIATLGASPFPSGTLMLFPQPSAPTGWTKQTTHNDKALRVVSGTGGGSGGSVAFSTVFGRTAVDASSLSIAQLAAHQHVSFTYSPGNSSGSGSWGPASFANGGSKSTDSIGSGSTHSHGLDLRVQYVDVIIASKD